ncbi:hypothetical protein TGVAND_311180 [Toxoplasma gondii VAND]|uniref:Uncharacterized protein n=1 Tax=Toxoplasma gondii VAND TaxID=933077 RepID=A0A086QA39_TOXGO|nr:hypothetical protein TGVAND_311180 [Toxoplasma gondii VAND]
MSLCACPVSGRPHPSTLLRQFADPRGRALSCFAVAETQGLIAVCTEPYDRQTQRLLSKAYWRTPAESTPSYCLPGDISGGFPVSGGGTEQLVPVENGTPRASLLGVSGKRGTFKLSALTGIPAKQPGKPLNATQGIPDPASRVDCQPALASHGRDAVSGEEKTLAEILEVQRQHNRCFDDPDRCGRCIIFLDSRSLLPLREVVIGDMPDSCENNLICCCCCGGCDAGLCRLCCSPLYSETSRRNSISATSQEAPEYCSVNCPETDQANFPGPHHRSRRNLSTFPGASQEVDRDQSPSAPPLRRSEAACTPQDKSAAETRETPLFFGRGDGPDFFHCTSLSFACKDQLVCAVSPFAGVKVLQLGELPVFAQDCRVDGSTACGDPGCTYTRSGAQAPENGGAFPALVSFDIEGRFPRLLAHLEFVPSFASVPACLEEFHLLDAGVLETREQQEALISRLWTLDSWPGPSCCGSAGAGERLERSTTSEVSSRFLGPCMFLDFLVHFRGQAPVRLVVDVTRRNRVLRCVSLLPRNLLLLCCVPSREESASLATPLEAQESGEGESNRSGNVALRGESLSSLSLDPSAHACVPASPHCAETSSPRDSVVVASLPAVSCLSGSPSLPSASACSPTASPASSPSASASLQVFPCPLPLKKRRSVPHKGGQVSEANEGELATTPAHAVLPCAGSFLPAKKAGEARGERRVHSGFAPSPSSVKSSGSQPATATHAVTARDFEEGTWKVKEGVRFPLTVFKKKEDFRLRLTAGIHVTEHAPVRDATNSGTHAPNFSSTASSFPFASPSGVGSSGGQETDEGTTARGTDYSTTAAFVPEKSFSHLEADFPVHAFQQLLLSQKHTRKAKVGETTGDKKVSLLPLARSPDGVPTLADVEPGVCAPGRADHPRGARQAVVSCSPHVAGEGGAASDDSSEEASCEDESGDEREGEGHPEEEWLVALALPNALVVVVDLHHRVVARHKFGLSKSAPFDRLTSQREGRFLLAWKERFCSVLELIDELEGSPLNRHGDGSRHGRSSFFSSPFYAPSGSLWRRFWKQRPPKSPPTALSPTAAVSALSKETMNEQISTLLPDTLAPDTLGRGSAGFSSTHSVSPAVRPPLRLRLHLELPVGARFGHSGSKVERFVTFAFSQDPFLSWLVVVSRRGVNEHLMYLIDLQAQEQRGGCLGPELFLDTAMLPVPSQASSVCFSRLMEWLPLTASDLLVLPSHRRFLAVLTDSSAPHQEEAFVAPYVHFSRLSSNREHLCRVMDFDRGSTDGSCSGNSEESSEERSEEGGSDDESEAAFAFSPFALPSGWRRRRLGDRMGRQGKLTFSASGGNEETHESSAMRGQVYLAETHSKASRKKAYRRLRERQRRCLEAAGLDPRLHANLEEKLFYQPLEVLRNLQQAPANCWATPEDIERWKEEEREEETEGGRERQKEGDERKERGGGESAADVELRDTEFLRAGPTHEPPPASSCRSEACSFSRFCARFGGYETSTCANRKKILGHLYASYRRNAGPPRSLSSQSNNLSVHSVSTAEAANAAATVAFRQAMLLFNNDHCQPVYWLAGRFGPSGSDTTTSVESVARAVESYHKRGEICHRSSPQRLPSSRASLCDFQGEREEPVASKERGPLLPFGSRPLVGGLRNCLSVGDAIGAWHMVNVSLQSAAAGQGEELRQLWRRKERGAGKTRRSTGGGDETERETEREREGQETAAGSQWLYAPTPEVEGGSLGASRGICYSVTTSKKSETEEMPRHVDRERTSASYLEAEKENGSWELRSEAKGLKGLVGEAGAPVKKSKMTYAMKFPRVAGRLAHALEKLDRENRETAVEHRTKRQGLPDVSLSPRVCSPDVTGESATAARCVYSARSALSDEEKVTGEVESHRKGESSVSDISASEGLAASETRDPREARQRDLKCERDTLWGKEEKGGVASLTERVGENDLAQHTMRGGLADRGKIELDNCAAEDDQKALMRRLLLIRNSVSFDAFAPPLRHRRRELPSNVTAADLHGSGGATGETELFSEHEKPGNEAECGDGGGIPERELPKKELTQEDVAKERLRGAEPALLGGKKYPNIWRIAIFSPE